MAQKSRLRENRNGTVINNKSKNQDKDIIIARDMVIEKLKEIYPDIVFSHETRLYLKDIVAELKNKTGLDDFSIESEKTWITPDGQFVYAMINNKKYLILISEKKNQGTNDLRAEEGKPKQAKGNAVERLAKNIRGVEMMLISEDIFPFVTFLDGDDFDDGSSIRDRVTTMCQFGQLNKIYVEKISTLNTKISRGSYFVRKKEWTIEEMYEVLLEVAIQSVEYYIKKLSQTNLENKI